MKRLLLLIYVFLLSVCAHAQLNGKYSNHTGYESAVIIFDNGKYFCYFETSCVDEKEGSGTYVVAGDKLILTFHSNKKKTDKKPKGKPDPFEVIIYDGEVFEYTIGAITDISVCLKSVDSSFGFRKFIKQNAINRSSKINFDDMICK